MIVLRSSGEISVQFRFHSPFLVAGQVGIDDFSFVVGNNGGIFNSYQAGETGGSGTGISRNRADDNDAESFEQGKDSFFADAQFAFHLAETAMKVCYTFEVWYTGRSPLNKDLSFKICKASIILTTFRCKFFKVFMDSADLSRPTKDIPP